MPCQNVDKEQFEPLSILFECKSEIRFQINSSLFCVKAKTKINKLTKPPSQISHCLNRLKLLNDAFGSFFVHIKVINWLRDCIKYTFTVNRTHEARSTNFIELAGIFKTIQNIYKTKIEKYRLRMFILQCCICVDP